MSYREVGDYVLGALCGCVLKECVGLWYLAEPGIHALGSCLNGPGIPGSSSKESGLLNRELVVHCPEGFRLKGLLGPRTK